MSNNIYKKIIAIVLFFLFFAVRIYAAPPPVSETVSVSARVGDEITVTSNTGGSIVIPKTAVRFSGLAYPNADIVLLKQGQKVASVKANNNGEFSITLEELYSNSILYSISAEDLKGNKSLLLNYPIAVQVGFVTELSGIRFAPTIVSDKSQVLFGDYLTLEGYSLPKKELQVIVSGVEERFFTLNSFNDGSYKIVLPMTDIPRGEYNVSIKYKDDTRNSKLIRFTIGNSNIFYTEELPNIPGDCNADKVINLVDFSVLAFWYGKLNPPKCVDTNGDDIINLIDFSILAYYWTS